MDSQSDKSLAKEYFERGASAMQVQIATWAVFKGDHQLAVKILSLSLPRFEADQGVGVLSKGGVHDL